MSDIVRCSMSVVGGGGGGGWEGTMTFDAMGDDAQRHLMSLGIIRDNI